MSARMKISLNSTADGLHLLFYAILITLCIIHAASGAPSSQPIELANSQTDQRQYMDKSEILSALVVAPSRVPANNTLKLEVGNTTTTNVQMFKNTDKIDIKLVIKEKKLDRVNRTQVEYHILAQDVRSSGKLVPLTTTTN